ncbi:hypothetical protein V2I80_10940 [Pseudomonas viridiflava]|uniref:hypothetical protein n=1 Tax=Pseudomonas viridiflava TaxID=33069 RepID=UPI002EC5A782|nr:hypothetical protein [Pseudomonas viridiflava]MEE3972634.1 hypothetical protein [Pseudomonas viridiflava]MEE4017476.1 hypothetical protein [Pseudomonas viridiflava]MEE4045959.1 hypothetical protein [Pseudomonas viridiflava]
MDVFRIEAEAEAEADAWVLYKAHGYKPIMRADNQADLIGQVQLLTHGKGAVIRFWAGAGVRELRVGAFGDGQSLISDDVHHD